MERAILNSGLFAMISLQLRGQLQKGLKQSIHIEKMRDNGYMLHWGQFHLDMRIFFLFLFSCSENSHSLEQPPQECDRIPVAGGFWDAVGCWIVLCNLLFPWKGRPHDSLRSFPAWACNVILWFFAFRALFLGIVSSHPFVLKIQQWLLFRAGYKECIVSQWDYA